jgi:2'-5' RNA ligase
MPAREIGPLLRMSTIAVTTFAAKNNIKKWQGLDGKARYSLGAFKTAHMEHNDTHPPQSCGIMIEIPEEIGATFPDDAKRGTPHATLLYVGKIGAADRNKVRDVAARVIAESSIKQGAATLGPLDYFDPPDDKRVAYVVVDFKPLLGSLHKALRAAVEAEGIEVQHAGEGGYTPHATLAYLDAGADYTGDLPVGGWSFDGVSLWWGDKRDPLPFVVPAPLDPATPDT